MAKVTEYPRITKMKDNDILLVDGPDGTRTILKSNAAKDLGGDIIAVTKSSGKDKVTLNLTDSPIGLATENDLDEVADALLPIGTASGNPAVVTDAKIGTTFRYIKIDIEPMQSGSGDPSPSNVRPISSWTGAIIHVSPTDDPTAGRTYSVEFPSEAGTVYGGVLDVTAGTLTVDRAYMSLTGAEGTWLTSGAYEKKYFGVFVGGEDDGVTGSGVCSHFSPINTDISTTSAVGQRMYSSSAYHKSIFAFRPENVTDMSLADFRTWVADQAEAGTPLQISWKLTQTQVYAVNPEIIAVLAGVNNVFADCGPVEVAYVKDVKIEEMIAEESDGTASRAFTVGEYVIVKDKLYKVTADISAGAELVPGTNVEETTVGEELKKIEDETEEDVSELKTQFDVYTPYTFTDGSYVDYTNGRLVSQTGFSYTEIPVSLFRGGKIKGVTALSPNTNVGIAFYDEFDAFIPESGTHSTNTGVYKFEYDLDIPTDAYFVKISRRNESSDLWEDPTFKWSKYFENAQALATEFETQKKDVNNVQVKLNELDEFNKTNAFNDLFNPDSNYIGLLSKYAFPDAGFSSVLGIDIWTDGRNFFPDFDITAHKNTGGTTYYFDKEHGSNYNDGLTKETAKQELISSFYNNTVADGDTLVFLDGMYQRFGFTITKRVNIIAENPGKVYFVNSTQDFTYTLEEGNVYKTTRSAVWGVIYKDGELYRPLIKKDALNDVKTNAFSFAVVDGTLYVNLNGVVPTNTNTFVNVQYGEVASFMPDINDTEDIAFYVEGITFVGGTSGTVRVSNTATKNDVKFYANKCNFYGASDETYDAISLLGATGFFVDCESAYAKKDGFNYHVNNTINSHGFEWNCKGYCCGFGSANNNNNGSTQHDGYIIRVNGIYRDNKGPNIADTSTSKSLNMKCLAFDSRSDGDVATFSADFMVQTDGCEMWLENCRSDFGVSKYNFASVKSTPNGADTTMHCNRCMIGRKFEAGDYAGTYVITNE